MPLHDFSAGGILSAVLFNSTLVADTATIDTGAGGIASGHKIMEVFLIARTNEVIVSSTVLITLNGDTSSVYDLGFVRSLNTTVTGGPGLAAANWALTCFGASAQTGAATYMRITFPRYDQATSSLHKFAEGTIEQVEDTAADMKVQFVGLRYRSTAAITQMTVTAGSGNLLAGSSLLIIGR